MDNMTKTKTRKARFWLKPRQVEKLRETTKGVSAGYLAPRNDLIIGLLYDSGLRVSELVALNVAHIDLNDKIIMLPGDIQKQHSKGKGPNYVEIELSRGISADLNSYLANRWKNSKALFPSRQSDRITTESVRNIVAKAAQSADIRPYGIEGKGTYRDITPHTLRHSLAYRMLHHETEKTLYDVRNRLRHSSIITTERFYDHFVRV